MALTTLTKIGKGITSFFKAKGATHARELSDRFSDVINVKDYGATGDGVTDDTACIQKALEVAYEQSKTVIVPYGVYILSYPLDLTTINADIRSYSDRTIYGKNSGIPEFINTTSDMFTIGFKKVLTAKGIYFKSEGKQFKCTNGIGITPDQHTYQLRLQDCYFTGFSMGLDGTAGSWLWTIEGCRFEGNDTDAYLNRPHGAIIRNNQWAYKSRIGLHANQGTACDITSNEFGFHSDITEASCILDRMDSGKYECNYLESYGGNNTINNGDGTYPLVVYGNLYFSEKMAITQNYFNHHGKYQIVYRKHTGENQNYVTDYIIENNFFINNTSYHVYFDGSTESKLFFSHRPSDLENQKWGASNGVLPKFTKGNKTVLAGKTTNFLGTINLIKSGEYNILSDNSNGAFVDISQSGSVTFSSEFFINNIVKVSVEYFIGRPAGNFNTDLGLQFNDYVQPAKNVVFDDPVQRTYQGVTSYFLDKKSETTLSVSTVQRSSSDNLPASLDYVITVEQLEGGCLGC